MWKVGVRVPAPPLLPAPANETPTGLWHHPSLTAPAPVQILSGLYCIAFVVQASQPVDDGHHHPALTTVAVYACAPFFAFYLALGINLADDPVGFLLSPHAIWDIASFVPFVLAYMFEEGIVRVLGHGPGEVSLRLQ